MNRIEQRAVGKVNEGLTALIGDLFDSGVQFDMGLVRQVRKGFDHVLELADLRQRPRLPLPYEAAACGLTG